MKKKVPDRVFTRAAFFALLTNFCEPVCAFQLSAVLANHFHLNGLLERVSRKANPTPY